MNGLCGKKKWLWIAQKPGSYSPSFSHQVRQALYLLSTWSMLSLGQHPFYAVKKSLEETRDLTGRAGTDRESTSEQSFSVVPISTRTLKISSSSLPPALYSSNPSLLHHKTEMLPQTMRTK